jgi:hypothetical protein
LPDLRLTVDEWRRTEWDPEGDWDRNFHLALRRAQGSRATTEFFSECESHAQGGRRIIKALRSAAGDLGSGRQPRVQLRDKCLQIVDLLMLVLSEVKFFEVKLHEYAPSLPLSQVSDLRMYTGV